MVTLDVSRCCDERSKPVTWLSELCDQYLTSEEAGQIHLQFQGKSFLPNNQVMWSGMLQPIAQKWTDDRGMQTLTTAMGPLKNRKHSTCRRIGRSDTQWSNYMKGASVLFAYYITRGETVTLLCPPPPSRFHPSGWTNYQMD